MEFVRPGSRDRYDALVAAASEAVIGLDMDGTLSPIVEDPGLAHIHPDAGEVLVELADVVAAIAVITGRPARQALALGGLDEVGDAIGDRGKSLHVFGQYGNERWSSTNRRVVSPRPPAGLAGFLRDLPKLLRDADAADAFVEEKGLAIAVHTRRLDDPPAALERLRDPLTEAAARHDLTIEPGRNVIEVRAPGMDKGDSVRTIAEEVGAKAFCFAGDDLGDIEAFKAVSELRDQGLATLLVCAAFDEDRATPALVERADLVVYGPDGVLDLLRQLTADARAR